jgi:hypothetical protein
MTMSKSIAVAVFALGTFAFALPLRAQDQSKGTQAQAPAEKQADKPPATPAAPPPAKPADVASPDAILAACYDVISGPAGQKRDWDRFRSLFVPGARLIPSEAKKGGPGFEVFVVTPDQYIGFADAYFEKNGFAEKEISRKSERFGNIMHVFSTYASRHDPKDPEPFERGINSFQLFFDGSRWWIVTIYWQGETADLKIPVEFLPAAK